MPEIPEDIWLHVASFIPKVLLRDMLAVNHVFFELAMNERYGHVKFSRLGSKALNRLIVRLTDPAVAKRVRCLSIEPCFHWRFQEKLLRKYQKSNRPWRRRISMVINRMRCVSEPDSAPSYYEYAIEEGPRKYEDSAYMTVMQFIAEAISGLSNVTEFVVRWWDLDLGEAFRPLFTAAFLAFGTNLRIMRLAGSVETFHSFFASVHCLDSLEELCLDFPYQTNWRFVDLNPHMPIPSFVAQSVNKLHPYNLRSMSISTWQNLDVSPFLVDLAPFPFLERFTLYVSVMSDPSGLVKVLHEHASTLRHIDVEISPIPEPSPPEPHADDWMGQHGSRGTSPQNLQTLRINPTYKFPKGVNLFMGHLRSSVETLTKLTLIGDHLRYDDVNHIVSVFSQSDSRLRYLSLNVRLFDAKLVDLLAKHLRTLEELSLWSLYWGTENFNTLVREDAKLAAFRKDMETHAHPEWKLLDVGVWVGGFPFSRRKVRRPVMDILAESIPSIQSFWGEGNMAVYEDTSVRSRSLSGPLTSDTSLLSL